MTPTSHRPMVSSYYKLLTLAPILIFTSASFSSHACPSTQRISANSGAVVTCKSIVHGLLP